MEVEQIEKLFDAKLETIHVKLENILEQTTKTNGRVTKIEEWKEDRDKVIDDLAADKEVAKKRQEDVVTEVIKWLVIGGLGLFLGYLGTHFFGKI